MPTVFDHLPAAVRALVPELDDGWDDQAHADCARCPMVAMGEVPPDWGFSAETRCCTAHPNMANFLVGRALGREASRPLIVARLADPEGVKPAGVFWPPAYERAYKQLVDASGYGHDVSMRCPYWVGGEKSCGIWLDRNAMCRAWYCRHDRGELGSIAWLRADTLVTALELRVADLLVARGAPPAAGAPVEEWIAWFAGCAGEAERLGTADVASIVTKSVVEVRGELVQLKRRRPPPLPDLIEPAISDMVVVGDDVLVTGYSSFDSVRAPRTLFALMARLDGRTPWRRALEAARAELRDPPWLDEALVRELYRVGAVRAVADTDS